MPNDLKTMSWPKKMTASNLNGAFKKMTEIATKENVSINVVMNIVSDYLDWLYEEKSE